MSVQLDKILSDIHRQTQALNYLVDFHDFVSTMLKTCECGEKKASSC